MIVGQRVGGTLTGGLFGEKVERINPLTGHPIASKYGNKLKLINPFAVVNKTPGDLIDTLDALDFPIPLSVPDKISGVALTPDEKNLLGKATYAGGEFPKTLNRVLGSAEFESEYNDWIKRRNTVGAEPKEESAWWRRLQRAQKKYMDQARRELRNGTSETSQHWRDTYTQRAQGLGTGDGGNMTPEQMREAREIHSMQIYATPTTK